MNLIIFVFFPAGMVFSFLAGLLIGLRETNRRLKRQREVMERLGGGQPNPFIDLLTGIPYVGAPAYDDTINASYFSALMQQQAASLSGAGALLGSPLQGKLGNATASFLGGATMQDVVNYSATPSQFQIGARTAAGAQAIGSDAHSLIIKNMIETIDDLMWRQGE